MKDKACCDCRTDNTGSKHKRCGPCLVRRKKQTRDASRRKALRINAEIRQRARVPA